MIIAKNRHELKRNKTSRDWNKDQKKAIAWSEVKFHEITRKSFQKSRLRPKFQNPQ